MADVQDENGVEKPTELEQKIIKQTEYYFGDMNLPKDKFLQQQIKEDDGWVTLETMTKFNRLSQLSDDVKVLATALKKSTSGLLEVDEEACKIRRSAEKPIPQFTKERRDDIRARNVYAKGFPEDSTLDQMQVFFEKSGKTEYIQMRKTREKEFKGSCFVVFDTPESAKKFIESEETAKYGETELIRSLKEDYMKRKAEEKKQEKKEEMRKKAEEREKLVKKQEEEKKLSLAERITPGAILHMKNIPEETTREDLRAVFEDCGTVAWVEFDRGDTEGKLRFQGDHSAKDAFEKVKEKFEGKVKVKDQEVECRVIEGEEELEYWNFVFQSQKDRMNRRSGGRGGFRGGRGGWGGRGGRGSKRRSNNYGNDGESSAKRSRSDGD